MRDSSQKGLLGLPLFAISNFPDPQYTFDTISHITFSQLVEQSDHGNTILNRLATDPRAKAIDGTMLACGTSACRLELKSLAAWWLCRANAVGIPEANKNLEDFLAADEIDVFSVLWLHGISTTSLIRLRNGLELRSLDEMPDSGDKEDFINSRWRMGTASVIAPTAALLKRHKAPKIVPELAQLDAETLNAHTDLSDTAILLNCLPGIYCFPAYSSAYSPPEVPLGLFGGRGGGFAVLDIVPYARCMINPGYEELGPKPNKIVAE